MRNATGEKGEQGGAPRQMRSTPIGHLLLWGLCVSSVSASLTLACQGDPARTVQGARPAASSKSEAPKKSETTQASSDSAPKPVPSEPKTSLSSLAPAQGKSDSAPALPPLRSTQKGFVVYAPGDCFASAPAYDLIIHFHGLADVVAEERDEAKLGGVLAVINAGAWARDYRRDYGGPGTLDAVLSRVEGELGKLCPDKKHELGRLALSGWSAGYSVIRHILQDSGPDRVDAVLLADGIHASLAPTPSDPRGVLPEDVESFVEFGRLAVEGKKLFSITHSSIQTPDYASTTETTSYLLAQLGLTRDKPRGAEALGGGVSRDPARPVSEVNAGGFHLRGYVGPTAPDHIWQIHSMGPTLFSDLDSWWARR